MDDQKYTFKKDRSGGGEFLAFKSFIYLSIKSTLYTGCQFRIIFQLMPPATQGKSHRKISLNMIIRLGGVSEKTNKHTDIEIFYLFSIEIIQIVI